jgi:hypothetical protein
VRRVNLKTAVSLPTEGNKGNEENGLHAESFHWRTHPGGERHLSTDISASSSTFVIFVAFCSNKPPFLGSMLTCDTRLLFPCVLQSIASVPCHKTRMETRRSTNRVHAFRVALCSRRVGCKSRDYPVLTTLGPNRGLEASLRSALRGAERARAQDQGQPPDDGQKLYDAAMDAATPEERLLLLRRSLEKDPENMGS